MKPLFPILLLAMLTLCPALALDVRDFGAMGDGRHIDSPAINAAIERAAEGADGGLVVLPQGTYLCYSIHLRSGITLRLERGAVLKAAPVTETEGYDEAEPNDSRYQDYGHSHWHNSLLWGENLHDLVLEGEGLIDGTDVLKRDGPRRGYRGMPQANKALALRDCRRVTLRGVSFLRCGHFALLLTGVDDLLIEDLLVDTNRDGIDIDCCERVVVRRCRVNTLCDDAIVLKCSYGLGRPKPTEHVLVEDCEVSGMWARSSTEHVLPWFKRRLMAMDLLDASSWVLSRTVDLGTSPSVVASSRIAVVWPSKPSMALRWRMSM